jgi:uncharacterized protein (DUF433 family)
MSEQPVTAIQEDPVPLRVDEDGAIRVGTSRVLLEVVLTEFNRGCSPQEIAADFPTLELADVLAACAYALRHKADVDRYIAQREAKAARVRSEVEGRFPSNGLREKIRARWQERHASPGG